MPDIRYTLRNGDKTSTGGTLIASGQSTIHHGLMVGLEGDYATCPACKAGGPVMNDCYPAFDIDGKQILVSGARVYCRCPEKPIVFESQADFTIEVNRRGGCKYQSSGYVTGSSSESGAQSTVVEECFEIIDGETGQPAEGYLYDLYANGFRIQHKAKFSNGQTVGIKDERNLRLVMWLDKSGEDRP